MPTFDFRNCCFICKEDADPERERERRLSKIQRRRLHVVTRSDFRNRVLNERNDDLAREVMAHIGNVEHLEDVSARYHHVC